MKNIPSFRNDYYFLSNMYPCKIKYDGLTYECSETIYIAMKFEKNQTRIIDGKEVNLREYFSKIKDGKFRKKEQQSYPIDKNFKKNKLDIMEKIIREKFKIPFLRKLLLKTEDLELVELNNWKDYFWGVCDGKGENHLGKILMKIREEIKLELKLKNDYKDNTLSL